MPALQAVVPGNAPGLLGDVREVLMLTARQQRMVEREVLRRENAKLPLPKGPVTFVVLGKPQPKQRARGCSDGRHRTPKETRLYERAVKATAAVHLGAWRKDGVFKLRVHAVFGDYRKRDASNVLKSCEDGLNGVGYWDDSQLTDSRGTSEVIPGNWRTVITLERLGDEPVRGGRSA